MDGDLVGIGAVAQKFGVSTRTIKVWEAAGILPPAARLMPGDRRVWRAEAIEEARERVERRRAKEAQPAAA